MMFLGSSVDEFQRTTLLISINLSPAPLFLAEQRGFPQLDSCGPGLLSVKTDEELIDMFLYQRAGFLMNSLLKY